MEIYLDWWEASARRDKWQDVSRNMDPVCGAMFL